MTVSFIDEHRDVYGVEPMCSVLRIAPSTYYEHAGRRLHPEKAPPRVQRDEFLKPHVQRVFDDNFSVYGARKIWKQLNEEEGIDVARCTIERLMRVIGLQGTSRLAKKIRTTVTNDDVESPKDLVKREFTAPAPNRLWVADFTYVRTRKGFVFVAFIIDVFSRRIVGWWASRSMEADLVLNALEQALNERDVGESLVHHSDRGSQYLSIRYTNRLDAAGIDRSVGSVGDSYDNALAESIIGLYKAEVIDKVDEWLNIESVELATFKWVDWFTNRRLFGALGYMSPAKYEMEYYKQIAAQSEVA